MQLDFFRQSIKTLSSSCFSDASAKVNFKIKPKEMLNLILFGPPGSGKGTQAEYLVKKYNVMHVSTGDLFRYEMGNNTPLGQKAKEYMAAGNLVPDEITVGMLRNKVEMHPEAKGWIFDGFPRTVPQAVALDNLLAEKGQSISLLVGINVPEDEIVKRIKLRGLSSGRSDDNDESIIRNRIEVYGRETTAVAHHYDQVGKTRFVDGLGTIEEIFERLCKVIDPSI